MLLLSDGVGFSNPFGELFIEIVEAVQAKRMEVISGRESFDAQETWMIDPARTRKLRPARWMRCQIVRSRGRL